MASQTKKPDSTSVQQPRQPANLPARVDTAFSETDTLVRNNSSRSRRSIAKPPLGSDSSSSETQLPLRSIFPTYNHDLPLAQQEYVPTQLSPAHIPPAVISRQDARDFDEDDPDSGEAVAHQTHQQQAQRPVRKPGSQNRAKWPPRQMDEGPPAISQPCTSEQLRSLWKVTNGWKASPSEGRVYCLRLAKETGAPVYTLSSASGHPFYNLRLDLNSTSANVHVAKHDPTKRCNASKPDSGPATGSKASENKHWHEALATTLEDESRKYAPNDGLIAVLMPTPAARMAEEKADDPSAIMVADQECARLLWDDESALHFLVHPALAHPFHITVEHSTAWTRAEYTLEHNESPQHLAKLTRDGTGGGWIELDTGVASQIDCYYVVDVAVSALMLVAASEDLKTPIPVEQPFIMPPPAHLATPKRADRRLSKSGRYLHNKATRVQEFEIDLESQEGSLGKGKKKKKREKEENLEDSFPFLLRVVVKILKGLFKCFLLILRVAFKCLALAFKCLYRCVGSKY